MNFYYIPVGRNKVPLSRNGEKDAVPAKEAAKLLVNYPGCNLALCTGPSKVIAVDMDVYKKVYVEGSLEEAIGERLPDTYTWRTGRGGVVKLFSYDGELPISRNGVLPAIDVKSRTGYVLMPGSINEQGGKYEVIRKGPIASAPTALVNWLNSLSGRSYKLPLRPFGGREEVYLTAGTGRWEAVRHLGGLLRRKGVGEQALLEMLRSFVNYHCEPDDTLREQELRRLAKWLASNPPEDPFQNETKYVTMPDGTTEEMERIARSEDDDQDFEEDKLRLVDGRYIYTEGGE